MTLYALITERPYGLSRLHDKLKDSIGVDYDEIKSAAQHYANQKKFDVERFSENLLKNIYNPNGMGDLWESGGVLDIAAERRFLDDCNCKIDVKQLRF